MRTSGADRLTLRGLSVHVLVVHDISSPFHSLQECSRSSTLGYHKCASTAVYTLEANDAKCQRACVPSFVFSAPAE